VAIKCIDRNMQKDDPDELDPLEALRREIIIMSQVNIDLYHQESIYGQFAFIQQTDRSSQHRPILQSLRR